MADGSDHDELPALPPYRSPTDPRDLKAGRVVSDRNGYYDSQNIVAMGDPAAPVLSVVLHHSENREGGPGLRLYATRSTDRGRTWSPLQPIESPERQSHDGYQLLHRGPDGRGRIFLFYGWNRGSTYPPGADSARTPIARTDMQLDEGYWFRWSDDGGLTWGSDRHLIPVRRTAIDRANPWGGTTMGMFLCDKPSVIDGAVYLAFQKTADGAGETPGSEVFLLRSPDLLHLDDPATATWDTLPRGDTGLQAPGGALRLGEEPHVLAVSDRRPGRLFCLWRTETGRLAAAYSNDGGETWGPPFWLTYEGLPPGAGGVQVMKNPRGSITPYRLRRPSPVGGAEFVLLFYNNGHTDRLGYTGRRVYWLTVGRETDSGAIAWAQPEIVLYWDGPGFDDRPDWNADWAIVDGPGYADWVELNDGTLACVESNKLAVRYHEIDTRLLGHLRLQPELALVPTEGRVVDWRAGKPPPAAAPVLPDLRTGGGFTVTVAFAGRLDRRGPDRTLASAWSTVTAARGEEPTDATITKGWALTVTPAGEIELTVTDGFGTTFTHATRTALAAGIWDGRPHVISFTLDGGPRVATVVVDERLDDGGPDHPQGWAFHPAELGEVGGSELALAPDFGGTLLRFLLFDRPLLTTEAIATTRALRAVDPG